MEGAIPRQYVRCCGVGDGGYVVTVAGATYKWQRVIFTFWQSRKPYNDQLYEAALRKSKRHLVPLFKKVELGKSPSKNPPTEK